MSSQSGKQDDLDGSAPDRNPAALLLIDVMNDFEFPGGPEMLEHAAPIAPCLHNWQHALARRVFQ